MVIEMSGEELDELGFVKYDCLGLSNLGVIDECLRLLGATSGESSQLVVSTPYESRDLPALPTTYDDPRTFELLSSGKTAGVFQLEGYGMRALLNRVRPTTFADVAAVLALYRPGPMGANAHNEYADRKNGKAIVEYPHPELRATLADVLSSTYGLVVYQEQVLEVLKVVGGYTYGTAGLIFDAMRKKNTAKMLEAEPDFHERMKNNGYSREASTALWDVLVPFSDYSFGKAHSYGYATISYWTGWLKANHPIEFYAALLSAETDPDKLAGYIRSAVEDDITLFPPDVNVSGYGWTLTKGGIRFGIAAIKGMSEKTYKALIGSRPYISMDDFWTRVPSKFLNIGVLTAATKSGLFDSLDPNREQILANLESTTKRALSNREAAKKGQHPLWKGYSVLPGLRRLGDRQLWEEEVLGISLTKRAVNIRLRRTMDTHEFEYLKSIFDRNPGGQPVNISLGDLTTLKRVARIALTDRALLGFEALGVTVTEEE